MENRETRNITKHSMYKSVSTIVNHYWFYCNMKAMKRCNPYGVKVIVVQSTKWSKRNTGSGSPRSMFTSVLVRQILEIMAIVSAKLKRKRTIQFNLDN